ncbi:hypothetical protein [Altericroceibacterium endophyticum]|uniref:Uncharacterized protein n=1 Tax=Altericroceibacterium endophyticum TaxID=1808508 RepID=A0A6I4TA09_9SPHN|nr:hypothetical protein [Altericroceibacterium endophyticum]MXO66710.1 hypothetical protein [Altericroceibacterium endophyticum]
MMGVVERRRRPMVRLTSVAVTALLVACGPMDQETPEPGETQEIKPLARGLGLTTSWTDELKAKHTGKAAPRASGAILYDWIRRG